MVALSRRPAAHLAVLAAALSTALAEARGAPPSERQVIQGRDGVAIEAELDRLEVPENRRVAGSRTISLAFLRIRSAAAEPGPPVFVLAGGPGGSAIELVRRHATGGGQLYLSLMGGDVVAIDQRGVGLSEPNLDSDTTFELPADRPGDRAALVAAMREVCAAEALAWRAKGFDLDGYNTEESADDIDAVRRHLGYERISLWGESYGTHLALATLRRHEGHVARMVLLGAEGPDQTLKLPSAAADGLARLAALAAADPNIGEDCPDLVSSLTAVLERLEREPVYVDVDGEKVGIGKFDVQWLVSNWIGLVHEGAARVPALVGAMAEGDFEPFARELLAQRQDFGIGTVMGMAMDAASGVSKERALRIAKEAGDCLLGDAANFPFGDLAGAWGIRDLGAEYRGTLRSDVPVLFLIGDLDSRTPIANARELMRHLPNAQLIEVANAGHDLNWVQPDVREAWRDFLAGRPVTLARATAPPLRFEPLPLQSR